MDLDATIGGATANSYVTLAAANIWLSARLGTGLWFDNEATMAQRPQALMWATALLDTYVQWYGQPVSTTQALAWPQTGQRDALGRAVPGTVIPSAVQQATAVYALALLEEQQTASDGVGNAVVKSRKVGDMTITYQDVSSSTFTHPQVPSRALPAEVRALLRPYGTMMGSMVVPLVRT